MLIRDFAALDEAVLYNIFKIARVPIATLKNMRNGVRRMTYLDALRLAHAGRQYISINDLAEQCVLTNIKRFQTPLGCLCAKASSRNETLQQRLDRVGIQRVRFNAMLSEPQQIREKTREKIRKAFSTPLRNITDHDFEEHHQFLLARENEKAQVQKAVEGICNTLCSTVTEMDDEK